MIVDFLPTPRERERDERYVHKERRYRQIAFTVGVKLETSKYHANLLQQLIRVRCGAQNLNASITIWFYLPTSSFSRCGYITI